MIRLIITQQGEKVHIMVCQNNIQEPSLCLVISRTNLAATWSQAALQKKASLIRIFNLLPFRLISLKSQGLHLFLSLRGSGNRKAYNLQYADKEKENTPLYLFSGNPLIWNKSAYQPHFSHLTCL